MQGAWVQHLPKETRSCMLHDMAKKKKNQTQSFPLLLNWTLLHSIGAKDTGRWTLVRSQPEKVSNSRTLYLLILLHSWILSMSSSCRFLISVPVGFFFSFFPVSMVKSPPARTGDSSSIRRLGRSPGEASGNTFQYSCLGNPMDGGAWQATVHGYENKSDTT